MVKNEISHINSRWLTTFTLSNPLISFRQFSSMPDIQVHINNTFNIQLKNCNNTIQLSFRGKVQIKNKHYDRIHNIWFSHLVQIRYLVINKRQIFLLLGWNVVCNLKTPRHFNTLTTSRNKNEIPGIDHCSCLYICPSSSDHWN